METAQKPDKSLSQIRAETRKKGGWFHAHMPFLFRIDSLFYYGIFLFVLSGLWAGYALVMENFSQLLNWDYTWQYIPFTYDYWDAWHTFFSTGKFPLYDAKVYLGTDMIGSGSYYGLFDPFQFVCYLFPREWIPQTYAFMTFLKLVFGGLMMRCYLKCMGIREFTARIGGVIYAFSGFTTFFEGSPNFTTAVAFLPLILWGIERVLRKQEPTLLILGVFGLGISCFFFLPVICIFGVIYALWRFFTTLKTRDKKAQILTMIYGIGGFAVGLALSAFSLLPSLRQTMLTGRGASVGTAYAHAILESLKSLDAKMLVSFVFEEVGDNPGRELMGVISFFFPTGGWTNLPLARMLQWNGNVGYDAWTSSLFCYTPCVILFFAGIMHSIRLRKWSHLLAVVVCVYAVLTTFSYYFFYAFSGNGYGRWFLILIPLIVYYCCWAFDERARGPRAVPFIATLFALLGTIGAYYLTIAVLDGKKFPSSTYNVNGNSSYWPERFATANQTVGGITASWYFYYQLAFVTVEGALLCIGYRKKWVQYALFGLVTVEVIVMGNVAYAFNGTWSIQHHYAGGEYNRAVSSQMIGAINAKDKSFFRVQSDTFGGSKYYHFVFGANTTTVFHSLMNFDLETFAINNGLKGRGGTPVETYNGEKVYYPSWSGYYGNKRYWLDSLLEFRYYIVKNNYSGWKDKDGNAQFLSPNVPFFSEELTDYSPNRDVYRVFRRSDASLPTLGYAIDSNEIYRMGKSTTAISSDWVNSFYNYVYDGSGTSNFGNLEWLEYVQTHGAIIDDDVTLPEQFSFADAPALPISSATLEQRTGSPIYSIDNGNLVMKYYLTEDKDFLFAEGSKPYYFDGPGYFLNHYKTVSPTYGKGSYQSSISIARDTGKLAYFPAEGTYLNDDPNGAYFEFHMDLAAEDPPRVYAIGDRFDEDGNLIEENACIGFESQIFEAMKDAGLYGTGERRLNTFGLFARGRVKCLVQCYGGKGDIYAPYKGFFFTKTERSEIETYEEMTRLNALQDVRTDVNEFTFSTQYDKDRIVVTHLGYDAGWGATAIYPDGSKHACQMLRLDGGLVGFVAPSVLDAENKPLKVNYSLRYVTPYSRASLALWAVGVVAYCGYLGYSFVSYRRKRKRAMGLEA